MPLPYQQPGLTMSRQNSPNPELARALQRDLRALGYLIEGIDGVFGEQTERALRSLQYDLLNNHGASGEDDGQAPVAVTDFNLASTTGGGRAVTAVTGVLDQALAACMASLLGDSRMALVPSSANPAAENARAVQAIAAMASKLAPSQFMVAMVLQESGGQQFRVPTKDDDDNFVVVGLDRNNESQPDQITSRGYGIGQYTINHHPPRPQEVQDFILDPVRNVQKALGELRGKFDGWVVGPADRANDFMVEHPLSRLSLCKYSSSDPRYMGDCKACAGAARKIDIWNGTPCYRGADISYGPTEYYAAANYTGVPNRADFACSWPYAVRRYNGGGVNSYHYQTRVLLNLLNA